MASEHRSSRNTCHLDSQAAPEHVQEDTPEDYRCVAHEMDLAASWRGGFFGFRLAGCGGCGEGDGNGGGRGCGRRCLQLKAFGLLASALQEAEPEEAEDAPEEEVAEDPLHGTLNAARCRKR